MLFLVWNPLAGEDSFVDLDHLTFNIMWLLVSCFLSSWCLQDSVAQLVTCLAADTCLTADPRVASSSPVWFHYFEEIDHEIVSMVIFLLLSQGYKQKYVHKVLVNCLVNLTQVKESVVR